jgi:hypothetical protein
VRSGSQPRTGHQGQPPWRVPGLSPVTVVITTETGNKPQALLANPLLTEPLRPEHVKPRLLGHWGTTPGLNLLYAHLNRVIKNWDLRDNLSSDMALDTVRKTSFNPTSRGSSHVRKTLDGLAWHWTGTALCRASAQVTQVFGTHRFAARPSRDILQEYRYQIGKVYLTGMDGA